MGIGSLLATARGPTTAARESSFFGATFASHSFAVATSIRTSAWRRTRFYGAPAHAHRAREGDPPREAQRRPREAPSMPGPGHPRARAGGGASSTGRSEARLPARPYIVHPGL